MPDDELKEWALSLCKEEEVIEWYLNADFATTITLVRLIDMSGMC